MTAATAISIPATGLRPSFTGQVIDAVSGDHVEGGVGDVDDAGHPEDQGETDGQQGQHAAGDQTGNDDVHNTSEEFIVQKIKETPFFPSLHRLEREGVGLFQNGLSAIFSSRAESYRGPSLYR